MATTAPGVCFTPVQNILGTTVRSNMSPDLRLSRAPRAPGRATARPAMARASYGSPTTRRTRNNCRPRYRDAEHTCVSPSPSGSARQALRWPRRQRQPGSAGHRRWQRRELPGSGCVFRFTGPAEPSIFTRSRPHGGLGRRRLKPAARSAKQAAPDDACDRQTGASRRDDPTRR